MSSELAALVGDDFGLAENLDWLLTAAAAARAARAIDDVQQPCLERRAARTACRWDSPAAPRPVRCWPKRCRPDYCRRVAWRPWTRIPMPAERLGAMPLMVPGLAELPTETVPPPCPPRLFKALAMSSAMA